MIKTRISYADKFKSFSGKTIYEKLPADDQKYIKHISHKHQFTFQEFRQVVEASRDLAMWGEINFMDWWQEWELNPDPHPLKQKKEMLQQLQKLLQKLRGQEKVYPASTVFRQNKRIAKVISAEQQEKNIVGMCPVASEKTVCCNLRTIDVVENCTYGCSYCTIQTFYGQDILVQDQVREKLEAIKIDPDRFYHFGTGQSSDSLVWGDRNNILSAHCRFAAENPNILVEFKTKSDNIRYFIENRVPGNIVCSWSLNTPTIIANEEHFTPTLDRRILAARKVADHGIPVAFHFHPMVWYAGCDQDYPAIARQLMTEFDPSEVMFISLGSITLIKPVLQKIRNLGNPTKILQMPLASDPHGKFTYPDEIKIRMFRKMLRAFTDWQDQVFFYLCMEKAEIWQACLGYAYENNQIFENEFGLQAMKKTGAKDSPLKSGENFPG